MKHKKILFDAIEQENVAPKKEKSKVLRYNVTMTALWFVGKIIIAVILTLIGSLILSAGLTAIMNDKPFIDTLVEILQKIMGVFGL